MRLNELLNLSTPQQILELTSGEYLSGSDKSSVLQKLTEVLQKQLSLQTLVIHDIDVDEAKAIYEGIIDVPSLNEIVLVDVHGEILDCLAPLFIEEELTITIDHIDVGTQDYENTKILVELLSAENSQCKIKLRNLNPEPMDILIEAIAEGCIDDERIIQDFENPQSREDFNQALKLARDAIKMEAMVSGDDDALSHTSSCSDQEDETTQQNGKYEKRKQLYDRDRDEIKQPRTQQDDGCIASISANLHSMPSASKPKPPAISAAAAKNADALIVKPVAYKSVNMKPPADYVSKKQVQQEVSMQPLLPQKPPMNDDEKRAAIKKLFIQALNDYLRANPKTPIDIKNYNKNIVPLVFTLPVFPDVSADQVERKKDIIRLMNSASLFNTRIEFDDSEPKGMLSFSRGRLSNIFEKLKNELDQSLVEVNNKALMVKANMNAASSADDTNSNRRSSKDRKSSSLGALNTPAPLPSSTFFPPVPMSLPPMPKFPISKPLASSVVAASSTNKQTQDTAIQLNASAMEVDGASLVAKPAATPAVSNAVALVSFGMHKAVPINSPNDYLKGLRLTYQQLHDTNEKRKHDVTALRAEQEMGERLKKDILAAEKRSLDLIKENDALKKELGFADAAAQPTMSQSLR